MLPLPVLLGAGVAVIFVLVFLLRRRKATNVTVFEKVEKAHQKDGVGAVVKQREAGFLNIVYGLAAAMVVADGRIEQAEIDMAEQLGHSLIPNFDDEAFVKVVKGHKQLPRFNDMVDAVAPLLPMEVKIEIYEYLNAIASADGQLAPDEKHYIHHVAMKFELDRT